jgi:hypothetical protein
LDRLILLLASPLLLFFDFRTAVVLAGHAVGPILGVAALLTLTGVARSILVDRVARWVPLLAATQYWIVYAYASVRPDHHGLQLLVFLLALFGLVRLLGEESKGWGPWVMGIGVGLAVWVSTEGLASAGFLLGVLGLVWVGRGGRELARAQTIAWFVAASVLALGLFVDGPEPQPWARDFDRFSVVHVTLFSFGAGFWAVLLRRMPRGLGGRFFAIVAGAILGGGFLFLLFPGIQGGPFSAMHPDLVPLWLDKVAEFAPADRFGAGPWGLMPTLPGLLGLALVVVSVANARRPGPKGVVLPGGGVRDGWMVLSLTALWLLSLSLFGQVRWTQYIQVPAVFGLAAVMGFLLRRVDLGTESKLARAGSRVALVILFFILFPVGLALSHGETDGVDAPQLCSPGPLVQELSSKTGPQGRRLRVLAPVFWGPELIFRAGVDVVAGPYHRNAQGMLDSYGIMAATESERAREALQARGIDVVVFCAGEDWVPVVPRDSVGTFYHALVQDRPPPWLERVPLSGVGEEFRMFRVTTRDDVP